MKTLKTLQKKELLAHVERAVAAFWGSAGQIVHEGSLFTHNTLTIILHSVAELGQ